MDSLGAPIHLRSPHSGVFREGQNPENRLHTPGILSPGTLHLPPKEPAHNWDTATAKNTSGGAEQQRGMHQRRIRSAVTPHLLSFWKKQETGTR